MGSSEETNIRKNKARSRLRLNLGERLALSIGVIIGLTSLVLFLWLSHRQETQALRMVEAQAQALLTDMLVTREWVSSYGGVWTDHPGEIYLEEKDGYFLKSPAMVTKELSNLSTNKGLYEFHITSLHLKNPDNVPDAFELEVLRQFEEDTTPVSRVEAVDGERFYRKMIPLPTTISCLECHADQGYQVGDIRGGLSVMLPMAEVDQALTANRQALMLAMVAIVALMVGLLYYFVRRIIVAPIGKLTSATQTIAAGNYDVCCAIHTGDELETLSDSFNQMVQNLKNSHNALQQQVAERTRELTALSEIALTISRSEDLETVLKEGLGQVIQAAEMDSGAVHLLQSNGAPYLVANKDLPVSVTSCMADQEKDSGFLIGISQEKIPFFHTSLVKGTCQFQATGVPCPAAGAGYGALVSVPLRSRNQTLGTLTLLSHQAYVPSDELIQFITCMGNQLGAAVSSSRYHEQVEQLATVEERSRIGRELHDSLAQTLGYLNLQTRAVSDLLQVDQIPQAIDELNEARQVIKDAYEEIRHAIFDLRYTTHLNGDFGAALREYLYEYALQSAIPVELLPDDSAAWRFPPEVEIQLLRIIQEALTNVRRHAEAGKARISLIPGDGVSIIRIEDDGRGIPPHHARPKDRPHFGLQIMRERAESIGGQLTVFQSEWGGAVVKISLPNAYDKEQVGR
ncbi:MAG TPA: DUF3365 domain-containing protein [Chloroflexi bacterium]|nr:DUF3365 domain-containing protein [Chloroflexota bacterium]